MTKQRTIALFLDGFEESLERRLAEDGLLPHLTRLRGKSARFLLEYGPAGRTGLAGEHVSTGRAPEASGRWSAVEFSPESYELWQEGARQPSFVSRFSARTVVFDMPYFDLDQAPTVQGIVNWGAHDPGVAAGARPAGLSAEFDRRVGSYPAQKFIYGLVWPSVEQTREMGECLTQACDARTSAATWLLGERFPDWNLALVCVSEPHSAIEGLWHGLDPAHPLHSLPSAGPAGKGLVEVYRAVDRLVGTLESAFPDANLIVFSMGGMGANHSDVSSMLLLPELAYRHAFGRPLFCQPAEWNVDRATGPVLKENEHWNGVVTGHIPVSQSDDLPRPAVERLLRRVTTLARRTFDGVETPRTASNSSRLRLALDWMPATRYQPYWSRMPFFALPSFYDGRIRVNLKGRERRGRISASSYAATCDEIEQLVRACRDPMTGEQAVDTVERPHSRDPYAVGSSESDLVVVWKGHHCVLDHPTLGRLGPAPYRRPGGHSGRYGMAYVRADGIAPGDYGIRSSFDVVPTVCGLIGEPVPAGVSGRSLFAAASQGVGDRP
jgi:predicted AlkP superfamily phosphohydrolase/phosphomutase